MRALTAQAVIDSHRVLEIRELKAKVKDTIKNFLEFSAPDELSADEALDKLASEIVAVLP